MDTEAQTENTTEVVITSAKDKSKMQKSLVIETFEEMREEITREIETIRISGNQGRMQEIRFLRHLVKDIHALQKKTSKAFKQKRTVRRTNVKSGFLKEVPISKDIAKFAGWEPEDLKSRVDVTRVICAYIKTNNLQNPADRRQIIPDKKLTKLLKLEKTKLKETPLTYFRLQKELKQHFTGSGPKPQPTK